MPNSARLPAFGVPGGTFAAFSCLGGRQQRGEFGVILDVHETNIMLEGNLVFGVP